MLYSGFGGHPEVGTGVGEPVTHEHGADRIRDLREYLNTDTPKARQFLERHIGKIVMEPAGNGYVASGTGTYLGASRHAGMVPRARYAPNRLC